MQGKRFRGISGQHVDIGWRLRLEVAQEEAKAMATWADVQREFANAVKFVRLHAIRTPGQPESVTAGESGEANGDS